jgi:hypothetical protein
VGFSSWVFAYSKLLWAGSRVPCPQGLRDLRGLRLWLLLLGVVQLADLEHGRESASTSPSHARRSTAPSLLDLGNLE